MKQYVNFVDGVDKRERAWDAWSETANETNATAMATKAAGGANTRHYVTAMTAGFSSSKAGALVQIKSGTTVIWQGRVHDSHSVSFGLCGLPALNANEAVSVVLEASGGAGVDGTASIAGYTADEV